MLHSLATPLSGCALGVNALRGTAGSISLGGWEAALDSSGVETQQASRRNDLYQAMVIDARVILLASNDDAPISFICHTVDANRCQLRGAPSATPIFNFIPNRDQLFANGVHGRVLLVIALLALLLSMRILVLKVHIDFSNLQHANSYLWLHSSINGTFGGVKVLVIGGEIESCDLFCNDNLAASDTFDSLLRPGKLGIAWGAIGLAIIAIGSIAPNTESGLYATLWVTTIIFSVLSCVPLLLSKPKIPMIKGNYSEPRWPACIKQINRLKHSDDLRSFEVPYTAYCISGLMFMGIASSVIRRALKSSTAPQSPIWFLLQEPLGRDLPTRIAELGEIVPSALNVKPSVCMATEVRFLDLTNCLEVAISRKPNSRKMPLIK
ncbi:hypothetical protein TMS3_0124705 [Pseudomonas taeanensis MS-3]|uniref:Uncharacterized protein n=1 Tax=Pseudomonas taeanensis MS-3 TaxID=1395571 RepID=A0A0A1YEI6_9PSED|nr:hypothetical protein [Pseudomonas taeanensis]KFX67381.1 hypothetical protein TMS3_0124705 [Pseudomonas taeanensis MS-3]OGQ52463.1 MAG: hypothetical protein A3J24_03455 [Deltaproteobacteria bacterium RIFCSPLOWO2_02_FULL_53_8]